MQHCSYQDALIQQKKLTQEGQSGWYFFSPNPTITLGKRTAQEDLLFKTNDLQEKSTPSILAVDRGGKATYHGPGQLVAFPYGELGQHKIFQNDSRNVRAFFDWATTQVAECLRDFFPDQVFEIDFENPGIYQVRNGVRLKVLSFGMRFCKTGEKHSFAHGFSLNLTRECLNGFQYIKPCGLNAEQIGFLFNDETSQESISEFLQVLHDRLCGNSNLSTSN